MNTTNEQMIELYQAKIDGEELQYFTQGRWVTIVNDEFAFGYLGTYRIKPKTFSQIVDDTRALWGTGCYDKRKAEFFIQAGMDYQESLGGEARYDTDI